MAEAQPDLTDIENAERGKMFLEVTQALHDVLRQQVPCAKGNTAELGIRTDWHASRSASGSDLVYYDNLIEYIVEARSPSRGYNQAMSIGTPS